MNDVVTNFAAHYDIIRANYRGYNGLEALGRQQKLAAVIVIGDLNAATRQFEATQVYAGSSVPGGTLDVVDGNVISRTFNQITVKGKGANFIHAGGSVVFNNLIQFSDTPPAPRVAYHFTLDLSGVGLFHHYIRKKIRCRKLGLIAGFM